jgi:ubiquinol-cytochrome c reductase cytochrome b subunit
MYLWPVIERRLTGDYGDHHLLERPRDNPLRTGIGVGILTFAAVLTLAGSNDVLGSFFHIPVENVTRGFRVLVLLLPPLFGWIAFRAARDLRDRELHVGKRVMLVRTGAGGFAELSQTPGGDGEGERDEKEANEPPEAGPR